jgi:hypothetical protein
LEAAPSAATAAGTARSSDGAGSTLAAATASDDHSLEQREGPLAYVGGSTAAETVASGSGSQAATTSTVEAAGTS